MVTGAASGMGRATARHMAFEGHPVLLVDVDDAGLRDVAAELGDAQGEALAVKADVRSREALEAAFASGADRFGPCWGLAAAAGVIEPGSLLDTDDERIRRQVDVNLIGLHLSNQLAARQMVERDDGGRIVNWASDSAVGAFPDYGIYAATKSAIVSLTQTHAVELAPYKITVNAVLPGATDTPMAGNLTSQQREALSQTIPLGRWGQPDEVAALAGFLFRDETSYMSGATLLVDGAITASMGRQLFGLAAVERQCADES